MNTMNSSDSVIFCLFLVKAVVYIELFFRTLAVSEPTCSLASFPTLLSAKFEQLREDMAPKKAFGTGHTTNLHPITIINGGNLAGSLVLEPGEASL